MGRSRYAPLLFAFAGVVFLVVAFVPRAADKRMNATFLALAVVFLVLALASYRRARATPPVSTDPRLPARNRHQKHNR